MPDSPAPNPDAAPRVEGPIANSAVGIGYAVGKLAGALSGDNGLRMLAIAVVASFTWVGTWGITRYTEMQTEMNAMQSRVGEDRIEREKSDSSRRDREAREWMAAETEKNRKSFADNVSYLAKEFALESEKNRAMLFKLATERRPVPGPGE